MLISALEPRRRSLCEVYLDGESAGLLDLETLERLHVKMGQEITDEDWSCLCAESDCTRARSYALWLLSRRAMTRRGLVEKLRTRYSPEASETAARRAEELGLIDDADYAARCASDLFRFKSFSVPRVVTELVHRGVDRELARQTAEEVGREYAPDPAEAIRVLLLGKYNRCLADEKGRRRAVAALQHMGYRWEEIRPVLRGLTEESAEE
jgi:Uncharacterized protein conserved in bacteria